MEWQFLELFFLLIYGSSLLFIFCYSLLQLHLTLLFRRSQKARPRLFPELETWPTVTVQLPVYNERYVIERLLDAIAAFDYPSEKLQIQVLDDSTDETVGLIAQKVVHFQSHGIRMEHLRRSDRMGYKAGALQFGLEKATGEFICIFDADFLPPANFLKTVIPAFISPETGVVQTRWGHLNADYSLLTRLQAFGLDAHFTVEQSGRNAGDYFLNFNGTAGIWRKKCILDAGGWEADTLTEDLDLSYRAQLKGWKFLYLPEMIVAAELPPTMAALRSQQYRWTKGAAETIRKHFFTLWRSPFPVATKLHGSFHLLNSTVFLALLLAALSSLPLLFLRSSGVSDFLFRFTSVFLSGFFLLFLFYWLAFRQSNQAGFLTFFPRFLTFLVMSMGLSLHNSGAVLEGFMGRKTPFIRTPKFNLTSHSGTWKNRAYNLSGISKITWLEGLLALVFWFALAAAFYLQDFRLAFFHLLLALGFSTVFFFSVKEQID